MSKLCLTYILLLTALNSQILNFPRPNFPFPPKFLLQKNCDNCGSEIEPVCGLSKRSYQNQCFLDCAKPSDSFKHNGYCTDLSCDCDDEPLNFTYECGSDDVKYENLCLLFCVYGVYQVRCVYG